DRMMWKCSRSHRDTGSQRFIRAFSVSLYLRRKRLFMSVYLHDIPLPEAQAGFRQAIQNAGLWRVLGIESIPLDENALGRVIAEPIWAKISSPHYHASAMDGFAVRAVTTT